MKTRLSSEWTVQWPARCKEVGKLSKLIMPNEVRQPLTVSIHALSSIQILSIEVARSWIPDRKAEFTLACTARVRS